MALYSQNIKNMVSGVSQQPPILRLPEQFTEQINGFSTEMAGLQKRPPLTYIKNLSVGSSDTGKPLVHFIRRDENEKYVVFFFSNHTMAIYDLDGNVQTLSGTDGMYIDTDNPREDLRVISVADYTFIVNKKITVKMYQHKTDNPYATQGCLVHIKQGQYGRTYGIQVYDGSEWHEWASYTTPDGSDKSHTQQIDTYYIVTKLVESLKTKGFTDNDIQKGDCWIQIKNAQYVKTQDGFNNQAMIGIGKTVQRFSLLPATAPHNYTVKVLGDPSGGSAGSYYVRYDNNDKVWKETVCPNIDDILDRTTMPHTLVRNSDGTFTFGPVAWGRRAIGDEDSNPLPSFVGEKINDVFFYRNRLGFLAGENVIMSESAEYFNFWMTTANDVLDTDPIDVSTTTDSINILNYAVQFNEELYCFSDSTQFILRSDTTLSPKNVALVNTTGYSSAPGCRPVVCGKNLYFPAPRAEYTSIMEYYFVPSATEMRAAQDISAHIASYIPNNVHKIIPSTNENIMLCLSDGDPQTIYVYKYLFQDEKRVQAAWSKWQMNGGIMGCFFDGSVLYVVINRGRRYALEKMNFTYSTKDLNEEPYRVFMDSKRVVPASAMEYDEVYERTAINLYNIFDITAPQYTQYAMVEQDGTYHVWHYTDIQKNSGYVYLDGDHSNETAIVGLPYMFTVALSPIYMQQKDSTGQLRSVANGRLQIRDLKINYADTGYFYVMVNSRSGSHKYRMTGRHIGKTKLGEMVKDTGIFRVPIQAENTNYTAYIRSDMPLPLSLVSYLWEGTFVAKSRGV